MRYLSLFSGIEAASAAWIPLGWVCVGVAEIELFPCKVLAHHYPDVPNLGDITKITHDQILALGHIDLVVGGFPCQDLSVAGKRKGLKNEDGSVTRSGLFFDAMRIIRLCRARFCLLENVPGIYSTNSGRDFAAVVGEILGVEFDVPRDGWENTGIAASERGLLEWSTLDAQWFGVPQRRRRMFALADFGDWASRPPVLFDSESLRGNIAPSREAGKNTAANAARSTGTCSGKPVFGTLLANCGTKQWLGNQEALSGDYHVFALAGNTIGRQPENGGNGTGYDESGVSYTLTKTDQHAVAFAFDSLSSNSMKSSNPISGCNEVDVSKTVDTSGLNPACNQGGNAVLQQMQVRRLTPKECERLQGFPDGQTNIPYASDTGRYKALGNSFAVPVVRWIGERIQAIENINQMESEV